jgi:hypothetical protein
MSEGERGATKNNLAPLRPAYERIQEGDRHSRPAPRPPSLPLPTCLMTSAALLIRGCWMSQPGTMSATSCEPCLKSPIRGRLEVPRTASLARQRQPCRGPATCGQGFQGRGGGRVGLGRRVVRRTTCRLLPEDA